MASTLPNLSSSRHDNGPGITTAITLASWRLRRTWILLCLTMLGLIAAIVIASILPLFITISTTAGLRSMLREPPSNAEINLSVTPVKVSSSIVQTIQHRFDPIFQHYLGPYMSGSSDLSIQASNFSIISPKPTGYPEAPLSMIEDAALQHQDVIGRPNILRTWQFSVVATSMQQAMPHIHLVAGRLPQMTANPGSELEIMLTPQTAHTLGLRLGSTMTLDVFSYKHLPSTNDYAAALDEQIKENFTARIVGLFTTNQANLAYWHGIDFEPHLVIRGRAYIATYSALFPLSGLLGLYDSLGARHHTDAPFTVFGDSLSWYYHIDPLRVSISRLPDIIERFSSLKLTIDRLYADVEGGSYLFSPLYTPPSYPYIGQIALESPMFHEAGGASNLEQYQARMQLVTVPVLFITLQIIGLLLFFASFMTTNLVEREADSIAMLRSRGASGKQLFASQFTPYIGLAFIAFIAANPLAVYLVPLVARTMLPVPVQDAVTVVAAHPLQSAFSTIAYAIMVVVAALLTMGFALIYAMNTDILSARRNTARSIRRPLWERLRLDTSLGIIALTIYCSSLYLIMLKTTLSATTQALIVTPVTLIAPFFLVIGSVLLSLRSSPFILRRIERVAMRGRSAISVLALAHLSRSPYQALRMMLLLALTTAFALFSLTFNASQQRNVDNLAAYQTGADFSGSLPVNAQQLSLAQQTALYKAIPGVTSASAGYAANGTVGGGKGANLTLEIRAVNPATFDQTAIWPSDASSQPLSSLLSLLVSKRNQSNMQQRVPVIIDAAVAHTLSLHDGSFFTISVNDNDLFATDLPCVVVAQVQHIPTTTSGPDAINAVSVPSDAVTYGGVLLDYQTYNDFYAQKTRAISDINRVLPINYIWLRTNHDTASLISVRNALNTSTLYLANLNDRFAILDRLHTDPLALTLTGLLAIGTVAALALALLGDLLASWLSARTRLTNFAVLRALGTSPRQVASVLIWEQGFIYLTGLLLGLGFGLLLSVTVIPPLIANTANLQNGLSAQLVLPLSLIGALLALIVVFALALYLMVRVVARPSLSQTLRLNED